MVSQLEDLDELVLRCRDKKARALMSEAIVSYRAGAFRASIVASWIAVCFDLIEKIRDLALAGDKEADRQVEELEKTRLSSDLARALKFEREILMLARDKFEFVSPLEFVDLERLQADRNRCAHPSLVSEDQAYEPPAELARLHIHSAIIHVLQHPAAQGRYALDRILKDIESEYFPRDVAGARASLSSGPLGRPREALVRSLVVHLVKGIIQEIDNWNRRRRFVVALQVVLDLHPAQGSGVLREKVSPIIRTVEDGRLSSVTRFLSDFPSCWQFLEADICERLRSYVRALPSDRFDEVEYLVHLDPFRKTAESRIDRATLGELEETLFFDVPARVIDRFITIYLASKSFERANRVGGELVQRLDHFSAAQIRTLLTSMPKNDQVLGSYQLPVLLEAISASKKLDPEELESLMDAGGLARVRQPGEGAAQSTPRE